MFNNISFTWLNYAPQEVVADSIGAKNSTSNEQIFCLTDA